MLKNLKVVKHISDKTVLGLLKGDCKLQGAVIRATSKIIPRGPILYYLLPTTQPPILPLFQPIPIVSQGINIYQLHQLLSKTNKLIGITEQVLQVSTRTMAIAGLHLAVTAVGFASLHQRLDALEKRLTELQAKFKEFQTILKLKERAKVNVAFQALLHIDKINAHENRRQILIQQIQVFAETNLKYKELLTQVNNSRRTAMTYEEYFSLTALAHVRCYAELGKLDMARYILEKTYLFWQEQARRIAKDLLVVRYPERFLFSDYVEDVPISVLAEWCDFVYSEEKGYEWIDELRKKTITWYAKKDFSKIDSDKFKREKERVIPALSKLVARNNLFQGYIAQYDLLESQKITLSEFEKEIVLAQDSAVNRYIILQSTDMGQQIENGDVITIEKHKRNNADILTGQATDLLLSGQFEEAAKKLEQVQAIDSEHYGGLWLRATLLQQKGKYPESISTLEKINFNTLDQDNVNFLYLTLGRLHYLNNSKAEGRKFFDLAIQHSSDEDKTRLAVAQTIFDVNPYNKEGVAILKDITQNSPHYAQAFKTLKLHLDTEAYFDLVNVTSPEELYNTEQLTQAIYHKMINEVNVLKGILYGLELDYQEQGAVLGQAIARLEGILGEINQERALAKEQVKEIDMHNYRAMVEVIAKTAHDVADVVNNGFFKLKSDIQLAQWDLAKEGPLYQKLGDLVGRVEQAEAALNDLKAAQEGITIRPTIFPIKRLFETWQNTPKFKQATIQLDIQNGEQDFYGDEPKIRSFINELVENSVNHNAQQENLEIVMASWDETNPFRQTVLTTRRYLVINVRDNGQGVPPDKKDWIFQPLNTMLKQGGGLGLFILHRTLNKMNGHITETGTQGADFRIYFPYVEARSSTAPQTVLL